MQNILITGANRGIGAELRSQYLAKGETVTGTTRQAPSEGFLQLDVTDPKSLRYMAAAYGDAPLDLLVCNAGIFADRNETLESGYPANMWADGFATNVTGVFQTIQAVLPNLKAANGKIAIISSQMGSSTKTAGDGFIYRASKAAVLNLGLNLSVALKSDGVSVGIYHPGWVQTDMGGSTAAITPEAAATGLSARFDALSMTTTGCFENWDGRPHAI
jgi:NAD(P)-dependent dehydrogenase (short-subunit alcohol dehydrogenase family)